MLYVQSFAKLSLKKTPEWLNARVWSHKPHAVCTHSSDLAAQRSGRCCSCFSALCRGRTQAGRPGAQRHFSKSSQSCQSSVVYHETSFVSCSKYHCCCHGCACRCYPKAASDVSQRFGQLQVPGLGNPASEFRVMPSRSWQAISEHFGRQIGQLLSS